MSPTKQTFELNTDKHYHDITLLRTEIKLHLVGSNFDMSVVGFVDGMPFKSKDEKEGVSRDYTKVKHFCIVLKNKITNSVIYMLFPYELPKREEIGKHIKQALVKYKFKDRKQNSFIVINKLV